MKQLRGKLSELIKVVNFDGIRCDIKGNSSIREIKGALKRQNEINKQNR